MATPAQSQPLRQTGSATIGLASSKHGTSNDGDVAKHGVTISPATTNQNLEFEGKFERAFPESSLRCAFESHDAFISVFGGPWGGAAFNTTAAVFGHQLRGFGGGFGSPSGGETKFPGKIIALSEDLAAGEKAEKKDAETGVPGVDVHRSAMTGASKGLISAIMTAYNRHCNLVLRPDDVWLAILGQFCAYVNNNAEGLRSRIVEHEGQKELKAYSYGSLETMDYQRMIRDILGEIRQNIKSPELADWFRPGFSTTTEKDEVCAAATTMASLQAYFAYTMRAGCGIPSVTMLGTVEDWKLLRDKIERLLEFEVKGNSEGNVMEMWVGYLRKVCDGFVESAEHPGSAKTLEFWDKVFSHLRGMSGSNYITGWLSAFTCFDKDGKFMGKYKGKGSDFPLINDSRICHNVVSCLVKIDDLQVVHDGTLFAGEVAFEAEQGEGEAYPTVRPRNDWCMAVAVKD